MDRPPRSPLARSFERHMRAQNRSERTIATCLQGLRQAETFLRERPDRARCTDERERATLRPTTLERGFDFWVLRDPWATSSARSTRTPPELLARRRP
jgi:hypothetical protein